MKQKVAALSVAAFVVLESPMVNAHISVASGPAFANTTQEITFQVAHGCAGVDTSSVRIEIPSSVTAVRTETSDFGKATVETDDTGAVTAVVWQKPEADLLPADTAFYKLTLRVKLPNQPYTTLFFPAHQTCKAPTDGQETVVDWIATEASADGGGPEPAPALLVIPAHRSGWNKFVVPVAMADLGAFFDDAQVVWKGTSAYSANPATTELIGATAGVTPLATLEAGDEIWVKY